MRLRAYAAKQAAAGRLVGEYARAKRQQMQQAQEERQQRQQRRQQQQAERREQKLANDARRAERREQKRAAQQLRVEQRRRQEMREAELAPLGITRVQRGSRGIITDLYYDVPPGVKPPEWMLSPDYDGFGWRVYARVGDIRRKLVKWGPRREEGPVVYGVRQKGQWLSSGWED